MQLYHSCSGWCRPYDDRFVIVEYPQSCQKRGLSIERSAKGQEHRAKGHAFLRLAKNEGHRVRCFFRFALSASRLALSEEQRAKAGARRWNAVEFRE